LEGANSTPKWCEITQESPRKGQQIANLALVTQSFTKYIKNKTLTLNLHDGPRAVHFGTCVRSPWVLKAAGRVHHQPEGGPNSRIHDRQPGLCSGSTGKLDVQCVEQVSQAMGAPVMFRFDSANLV
jgi:hypothetical protein